MAPHDAALLHALKIRPAGAGDLAAGAEDHVAVQESTIAALLDGAYDGDLTIGELLRHGDHGLGTLNGLDGELVIVDGEAWRAGADGSVTRVDDATCTPFAVATRISDAEAFELEGPLAHDDLLDALDAHLPVGVTADVVRIDGRFDRIHARSVPRQEPPYRPLADVGDEMVEWTWTDLDATVVGFRFGQTATGVEVTGHHLHVLSADRTKAGHVLACDLAHGHVRLEPLDDLRVALPPGVEMPDAEAFDGDDVLDRLERG